MQWREHQHHRLHKEGLLTEPQADPGDAAGAGDHCCGSHCQAPEEDEQTIAHKVRAAL